MVKMPGTIIEAFFRTLTFAFEGKDAVLVDYEDYH